MKIGQLLRNWERKKTGKSDYRAERRRTRCRNLKIGCDSGLTSANECVLSCSDQLRVNTFFPIVDQLILAVDKQTDAYSMLSNRFSFLSEHGRDTANIDDMRKAGEKLAVVYSNDIEEHSVCSELLQFSHFVNLCVNEKQGDETHETFMHRLNQERSLTSLFPTIAIILRRYLCLMCSNSSGERSFSKLKRIKNELRSSKSQQRLNHLSLMSIESEQLRNQNFDKLIHEFVCKKSTQCTIIVWVTNVVGEVENVFVFLSW